MMWQVLFALGLFAGVVSALLAPSAFDFIKVDVNNTLGTACFFLGLATSPVKFKDLVGTQFGLGNIAFSFFIGTFLWPALGLAATVLALQLGLPFAVVVGLALLAACPVGGPSSAVNVLTAGGSLECSVLLCALSTPAALITFPYAYRHFLLLLLDQPLPAAPTAEAAASQAQFRVHLAANLDVPAPAMAVLRDHALLATCLPLAAGALLSALLPAKVAASARRAGPMAAAAMIVLTVSAKTAAGASAVHAAGFAVLVGVVATLHVAALALGFLIPAGVRSPGWTCRTCAYQASMRNPALGLALVAALFGGSPQLPLLAAPCVVSVFVQNVLGAASAALGAAVPPRRPVSESGGPLSPQAFRANSMESILRQQTFKRKSNSLGRDLKDD